MIFSKKELHTIECALRCSVDAYRECAKKTREDKDFSRNPGLTRLAQQFDLQEQEALELLDRIEAEG